MPNREGAGLYDRLLATGVVIEQVKNKAALAAEKKRLEEQLRDALVFDIQNVADYYYSFPRREKTWHDTDFPKVAPPFKDYFMEFRPRKNWPQGGAIGSLTAFGVLSHAYDLQSNDPKPYRQDKLSYFPNARWIVINTIFIEDHKYSIRAWTQLISAVQPNGDMVRSPGEDPNPYKNFRGGFLPALLDHDLEKVFSMEVSTQEGTYLVYYPTLLALSFLHCKNVTVETEEPQAKLSKVFQRKHGRPLIKYHVLNIEPMKTVLKTEGRAETVGLKRALHIVRGHFADYTEKGLFGRHRGIYWFDQHARGSAEEGVVLKDYRVDQPRQNSQL